MPLLSLALGNLLLVGCVSKAEASRDASSEDIADLAASLAATQAELAELKSSVDCFVGHMTDDRYLAYYSSAENCELDGGIWIGLEDQDVCWVEQTYTRAFNQGDDGTSDALYAYNDCF